MEFRTVAFVASGHPEAKQALKRLEASYEHVPPDEADIVVALGGDGFMLETLHRYLNREKPIFGMNRGSVGFLMNTFNESGLMERLARAEPIQLNPLRMTAIDCEGVTHEALAINEVSLLRETRFAAKLRIEIDGIERMPEMICDGVLVATPAGSTAYNVSVSGPILPLGAHLLALTPISVFRPRQWRGAILPREVTVTIQILNPKLRPASAVADFTEVRNVQRVEVQEDRETTLTLLFDPEHDLEERVIKEQFLLPHA
jgi:NAD+ kinase